MKTVSLLKAILSENMNLFNYQTKKNSKKLTKVLIPIFLFGIVCFSMGFYANALGEMLHKINLTYIMLSMFIAGVTVLAFIEGIYKSQGILFESKDNELLLSLPVKRSIILFSRLFKLLLFEYLYNLLFLLPAFVIYIYYEHPGINFYLISILMTILIPIIPTILGCFFGYLVKLISSKFKSKKIIQAILTCIIFVGIFLLSQNMQEYLQKIVSEAKSINELLSKIYYPIGAYSNLINKFDLIIFIKLLLINIMPFILFIIIGQKYYFKIILKSNSLSKNKKGKVQIKSSKPLISLTKKEVKRYFSSPVYMFNTGFGVIILFIFTIILCFKGKSSLVNMLSTYGLNNSISVEMIFYGIVFFSLILTSITSSSISLEGKTINITKSLPIDFKFIFNSKILNCYIIELPLVLLSLLIFIIKFRVSMLYIICLIIISLVTIFLNAVIGLLMNLKYPKLNYTNDTEVVKQSMSSMISVFISFAIFFLSVLGIWYLSDKLDVNIIIIIHLLILSIMSFILYIVLIKKGPEEYKKLNV